MPEVGLHSEPTLPSPKTDSVTSGFFNLGSPIRTILSMAALRSLAAVVIGISSPRMRGSLD
ncbi:hypothetical protein LB505_000622 [Fusarium chuoi]|nr:hypothetical protein LB505_000622 [Fusarium chuoi]